MGYKYKSYFGLYNWEWDMFRGHLLCANYWTGVTACYR